MQTEVLLTEKISKIYFKYIAAAFGSALILSIYSFVDTIVVGRYEGPNGSAALAAYSPMWAIMFACGLLFGIGGSVIMSQKRGAGEHEEGNRYFALTMAIGILLGIVMLMVFVWCDHRLLYFFGGRGEVLTLALKYSKWMSLASPLFFMGQIMISFVRNDGHPEIATFAVMIGGAFNIFGDIYFTFGLDMGIEGAGLATASGQVLCVIVLTCYMLSKKCSLVFDGSIFKGEFKILGQMTLQILKMGVATFVVDISLGILTAMINNQIIRYSGASALAAFGVINTIMALVQCFGYAVGQSSQALMSVNYGGRKRERIIQTRRLAALTALIIGAIACGICTIFTTQILSLFMAVTDEVLVVGVPALRIASINFIMLDFNVIATYYFQAINRPRVSLGISLARGIVISSIMVYVLPLIFGVTGIWMTVPITEFIVIVGVLICYRRMKIVFPE